MRFSSTSLIFALVASAGLAGCETTGSKDGTLVGPADGTETARPAPSLFGGAVAPALPPVDNDLEVACQEAAGDKYFMDPDLVHAVSASKDGANTAVILKVDTRDALCTLNAKNKVISVVDTSPKSADQIAAETQKAADIAAGKVPATPAKAPVKKLRKKKAKVAAPAATAPAAATPTVTGPK